MYNDFKYILLPRYSFYRLHFFYHVLQIKTGNSSSKSIYGCDNMAPTDCCTLCTNIIYTTHDVTDISKISRITFSNKQIMFLFLWSDLLLKDNSWKNAERNGTHAVLATEVWQT